MAKRGGSIRDVAREAGLSTATVSRVMNGTAKVNQATREKVLAACNKLDYLPNPAARALSTARSKTIAAIIPTIENSVFAKFIGSIEGALATRGYTLVLAIATTPEEEEVSARNLLGMGAEAFILSGATHSGELLGLLKRRRLPFVFSSVWNADDPHPTIGYDNEKLAARAMDYLQSKGHRNIGLVYGHLEISDRTRARMSGARGAAKPETDMAFASADISIAGGKDAAREILAQAPKTTAILCFSDVLAMGGYFALAEDGLRVPEDISVMGFDNLDWAKDVVPPLTTMALPSEEMGAQIAHQLADHLETQTPLTHMLIDCALIERASVRDLTIAAPRLSQVR